MNKIPFVLSSLLFLVLSIHNAYGKISITKNLNLPALVETKELKSLIYNPSVRIIDLRSSLSDYLRSHIPHAYYLHSENLMIPEKGIPAQNPNRIYLERLLGENLCIANNMVTILYSEKSNANTTFFAWSLEYLGYKKFAILNGGWEKWVLDQLPVSQEFSSFPSRKFFGKVFNEILAEKRYILKRFHEKNLIIIDVRTPKEYSGEEGDEIRKGHIPGAINIPWETTLEGNEVKVWKKKEDLERYFFKFGVTKDKEVIIYCRTGKDASHLYFTLKHILHFPNVRLYRGSWIEWSADISLPVKVGYEP